MVAGIFNITHSNSLGKYLGCLVLQKRPNSLTFQELLSKARNKLVRWKANNLSKAGHVVLIQSTLEILPAHMMQCFKLPVNTATQLDCINREFFWQKIMSTEGYLWLHGPRCACLKMWEVWGYVGLMTLI